MKKRQFYAVSRSIWGCHTLPLGYTLSQKILAFWLKARQSKPKLPRELLPFHLPPPPWGTQGSASHEIRFMDLGGISLFSNYSIKWIEHKIKADWNHKAFVTTENQNTGGRLLLGQCFGGWKFQHESHVKPTISPQKVLHLFRSPAELKWSPLDHSCVKSLPKLIRKEGIPASQEVPKGMGELCGFLFPTYWGGRVMHSRHLWGGRESVQKVQSAFCISTELIPQKPGEGTG